MKKTLIIRADANTQIGTGHFMRCLALGQAWKDAGGGVIFITSCKNEDLLERLTEEKFVIKMLKNAHPHPGDWKCTKEILSDYNNSWVVLDGYHFDEVYQEQVKKTGLPLLIIDDMAHLTHYYADIILNQNLHAENLNYSCESYTRLLLGTKYVLLRREFLKWHGWKREIPKEARNILVTLGGADPDNVTLKIIQALQMLDKKELVVKVIVGGNNPHFEGLQSAVKDCGIPIQLIRNTTNMPKLMAWADIAVSGAGTTSWEKAFMGLPGIVFAIAKNQKPIARSLEKEKLCINLGSADSITSNEIAKATMELVLALRPRLNMCKNAINKIDGKGIQRVLETIMELNKGGN